MTAMRRALLLVLILMLPLQTAWSVGAGMSGHIGGNVAGSGLHSHDHDHHHHDGDHDGHDLSFAGDVDGDHNDDGHHVSHCHPVFIYIPMESSVVPGVAVPDGPIPSLSASFVSHTPPLIDRPPLARA